MQNRKEKQTESQVSCSWNPLAKPGAGSDSLPSYVKPATMFLEPTQHPGYKSGDAHLSLPVMVQFMCQLD